MPHDPTDAGLVEALGYLYSLRLDYSREGHRRTAAVLAALVSVLLLLWEQNRQMRERVEALEDQADE